MCEMATGQCSSCPQLVVGRTCDRCADNSFGDPNTGCEVRNNIIVLTFQCVASDHLWAGKSDLNRGTRYLKEAYLNQCMALINSDLFICFTGFLSHASVT